MKYDGYIESPVNELVHVYENLEFVSNGVLPKKWKVVTPIRDQMWSNLCVSFSGTSMLYADMLKKYGESAMKEMGGLLSPTFTQSFCKKIDSLPSVTGTTGEAFCRVATKQGACSEKLMPFDTKRSGDTFSFPSITDEMCTDALKYKANSYARVSTVDGLKKAVYESSGAIIAIAIFPNFDKDKKGYIGVPNNTDYRVSPSGNHMMFVCGYDDDHEAIVDGVKYKGFFIIQDSYNESVGSYGYRYLAYDLFNATGYYTTNKLVRECWTLYETGTLVDPDYHTKKMETIKDAVMNVKLDRLVLTLGSKIATFNGQEIKMLVEPKVISGTTLVPLRFISERFNCSVFYTNTDKRIRIYDNHSKRDIIMFIGNNTATIGGKPYTLLVSPIVENGTTLVPLRAISEMLDKIVNYDAQTKTITILG